MSEVLMAIKQGIRECVLQRVAKQIRRRCRRRCHRLLRLDRLTQRTPLYHPRAD